MSSRSRLLLDLAVFAAAIAAFNPALTGLAVHEWLSVAVIVPALFHLIINWEQTLHMVDRFLDKLTMASRLNLLVDVVLFVSAIAVTLSGLAISQVVSAALGVTIVPSVLWVALHSVSADVTIALLAMHFALHWRWVANTVAGLTITQPRIQEDYR
jgi:hypothetical protein